MCPTGLVHCCTSMPGSVHYCTSMPFGLAISQPINNKVLMVKQRTIQTFQTPQTASCRQEQHAMASCQNPISPSQPLLLLLLLPRAPTHTPQLPSAQQRHEGEGRGFVLRMPKEGLSAGTWRRKVVMCPRRGNDPASGHPRARQPPLGRGTSTPARNDRLDTPGQRRRHLPCSACTQRREVKQGRGKRKVKGW